MLSAYGRNGSLIARAKWCALWCLVGGVCAAVLAYDQAMPMQLGVRYVHDHGHHLGNHYRVLHAHTPWWHNEHGDFAFLDTRFKHSWRGFDEVNVGLGVRHKVNDHWLGANGFLDYMAHRGFGGVWQGTLGVEFLHPTFIARSNAYFPWSSASYAHGAYVWDKSSHFLRFEQQGVKPVWGVDGDLGPRIRYANYAWSMLLGGGYVAKQDPRGSVFLRMTSEFSTLLLSRKSVLDVILRYTKDRLQSKMQAGIGLRLPLGARRRDQSFLDVVHTPIDRDLHVLTDRVKKVKNIYQGGQSAGPEGVLVDEAFGPDQKPQVAEGLVAPSHQFFAPIAFRYLTQYPRFFTHPLGIELQEGEVRLGLTKEVLSHMGADGEVTAAIANTLVGDITLASDTMQQAKVVNYGEFHAEVGFQDKKAPVLTFTQGSPYVFVQNTGDQVICLRMAAGNQVESTGDDRFRLLRIAGGDRSYMLSVDRASDVVQDGDSLWIKAKNFSVAALPANASTDALTAIKRHAFHRITDTYTKQEGNRTTFGVRTEHMVSKQGQGGTVFGVYPHQSKNIVGDAGAINDVFKSIRGDMRMREGREFAVELQAPSALAYMPLDFLTETDKQALRQLLQASLDVYRQRKAEQKNPLTDAKDTYWVGKALHSLSEHIHTAHALGACSEKKQLLDILKHELEAWFSPGGDQGFVYNPDWGVVLGRPASFATDKELNDLHFHLGYFIEASATVGMYDQAWMKKWRLHVDPVVRSIINYDQHPLFMKTPHRVFRPYAGFSQASGHASFADGGNHESSSEAMNAWSSSLMWGHMTGNTLLQQRARQAFYSEAEAIWTYYFNNGEDAYHVFSGMQPGYQKPVVGMVWDNKYNYATWFSGKDAHILGIQLLPLSARSLYLARDVDFINSDAIRSICNGADSWQDLLAMHQTLGDGTYRIMPGSVDEAGSKSSYTHWQRGLSSLGVLQSNITANSDFASVFQHASGQKTYVAYNPGLDDIWVTFSDGMRMHVAGLHQKTHRLA